jgi:asparagine synthase (glutamine-hydrolysing)
LPTPAKYNPRIFDRSEIAMALLFGCHDPSLDAMALERLLDAAGETALLRRPWVAGIVDGSACAAYGGDAHRGLDGVVAAINGFPRWQDAGLAELAAAQGHGAALAEAWRRHGEKLCAALLGAFSLAVIDSSRRTVFLALDRIGQQHLFHALTPSGALVFGSSADAVLTHAGVSREIDPQAIFDYVYSHHCPSPGSIYKGIRKLDGAECLVYRDGQVRTACYWQPEFREEPVDKETLGRALREAVFNATARFGGETGTVGAFLSGGLDSSTVAGALAKARPGDAPTFSMGFPVEGYDEMHYARIAAEHFKTQQHEFYLSPDDAVAAIPKIAAAYDEPFGNSSALPTYFCARMAKENGIGLLLGGDGGDELFAGNERYAKQLLFERYFQVPRVLRSGLEAVLHRLPEPLSEKFPFNKADRYVEQANVPLPDRLHDYNFLNRVDLNAVFAPDFLDTVDGDAPLEIQRQTYRRVPDATALNRMLYLDWEITLHDNDLVKVNRMCELAGVEVAYPLLDDDVVELSCRVPSNVKLNRGRLRAFYKDAMIGFLPDAILRKTKHGFGLPFGIWLKDHAPLRDLAYDSVNRLKERPYFLPGFLDEAVRLHGSGHAAYYGELIWILMMLELWFDGKAGRAS